MAKEILKFRQPRRLAEAAFLGGAILTGASSVDVDAEARASMASRPQITQEAEARAVAATHPQVAREAKKPGDKQHRLERQADRLSKRLGWSVVDLYRQFKQIPPEYVHLTSTPTNEDGIKEIGFTIDNERSLSGDADGTYTFGAVLEMNEGDRSLDNATVKGVTAGMGYQGEGKWLNTLNFYTTGDGQWNFGGIYGTKGTEPVASFGTTAKGNFFHMNSSQLSAAGRQFSGLVDRALDGQPTGYIPPAFKN